MSIAHPIPRRTLERLANPAPPGQRHTDIVNIAIGLVSARISAEIIFQIIRPNYGPDLSDREIRSAIKWAENRFLSGINPLIPPLSARNPSAFTHIPARKTAFRPRLNPHKFILPESPENAVHRFSGDFRCDEADLWERSPIRLAENPNRDAETLISALFGPEERINIVSAFGVSSGKPHPIGTGKTRKAAEWLAEIGRSGPPECAAGAWIRPNPLNGSGVSDADVSAFRFLLLESDSLSLADQLAFFARLPLPIATIISSGGKSLHAWVRINAASIVDYRAIAARIYAQLAPFGIDPANKNPSRMSRLPGIRRKLGSVGDGQQRLLYLNAHPTQRRIIE